MARTQAVLDALVAELQQNCGDEWAACRTCGISLIFLNQWRRDDADVDDAIAEATRVGAMSIQSEAIRRAVRGYQKPVYYKGVCVDHETVYSDGLMQAVLKARLPDIYAPDSDGVRGTFNGPTQINIMPRANNYDEWLRMKSSTLALREPLPALEGSVLDLQPASVNLFERVGL